jgi:acyl-CoA synthetase (AMP-forming)/AMP-acid ligase II
VNIALLLTEAVRASPDRPALILADDSVATFRDVEALSSRLAGGLFDLGLRAGDRAIVLAPISLRLYTTLIALFRLGATAVLLDPQAFLRDLDRAAALAGAKAFIGSRQALWLRWLSPALRRVPLCLSADGDQPGSLQDLACHASPRTEIADVDPETPALITFTGGNTDAAGPRGVLRTHRLLIAQHHALARALPLEATDVDLPSFPVVTLHNLAANVTSVIPDFPFQHPAAVQPERILRQIGRFGVTTASGSPAYWRPIADHCLARGLTLPLRRLVTGGAPASPDLIRRLGRAAPRAEVLSVYGSTEAEPVAIMSGTRMTAEAAALTAKGAGIPLGFPIAGINVRILGQGLERQTEQREGEPGEIWAAGNHVARGYYANPRADAANFLKEGSNPGPPEADEVWYRMGDVGYKDAQGCLWLVGRVNTTIIRGGQVLYPLPVESVGETLAFVGRAALVGLPNERLGERAVLAVQFKPGVEKPRDWQARLRAVCAACGWPLDEVRAVSRIPVDARHNARIDYARLRQRLSRRRNSEIWKGDWSSMMRNSWAYLQERFPPLANGLLILSYFTANYLLARSAVWPTDLLGLSWRYFAGCVALLLMLFHLRVIDEHKDYEQDRIVHPNRVLSRGLVTLGQLRLAGFAAVALELALALALGPSALVGCLMIFVLSWLVYKEFYLSRSLQRHLLLNAFVHMIMMPAYCLFVFAVATGHYPWEVPGVVLLYALVSYGVGFAYELARKTRAPHDERPGLVTYSSAIGPYPSAFGVLVALLASGLISMVVGRILGFAGWYHGAVVGLLLIVTGGVLHFRLHTTTTTAARLQTYAGLFIFAFDWLLAAELIRLHSLTWT